MELELTKAEIKANEILNEANKAESDLKVESKEIQLENELPLQESKNTKEFSNVVFNVIDKGVNYAIKSLPIANGIKDVALDVKEALKTNDFKYIVKTAVGSSIREGLEVLGMPINVLKNIKNIQNVAMSGGLTKAISAGIDIIYNKYLKNNVFCDLAKKFVDTIKGFICSKEFTRKIQGAFDKIGEKINKFKDTCKSWYDAYEVFDVEKINVLAKDVAKQAKKVGEDTECISENKLIQNITSMISNTKHKLSEMQMDVCKMA